MQSRKWSAFEAITNTILSFVIAYIAYFTLIPWIFGVHIDYKQSAGIVAIFNCLSLTRQFILRRLFNSLEK